MPQHPVSLEQLLAFAAGQLSATESAPIEEHILGCIECFAALERMVIMRTVMRVEPGMEPPADLVQRAQAIYRPLLNRTPLGPPERTLFIPALVRRGAALVMLLLGLLLAGGGLSGLAATADDS